MTAPASVDARPAGRLRVVMISGRNHPDYDLAAAAAMAPACELLLCVADGPSSADLAPVAPGAVVRLPWPRHRQIAANLRLLVALRREIARFAPDVVHILSEGQVWLALLPRLIGGVPVVVTLHDVDTHPGDAETARIPRRLVDWFVKGAAAVIVHGEGLKAAAVARLGLSAADVFAAIHPLIWKYRRLADAAAPAARPPVRQVLFFGRIADYKGLPDLIAADERLGDEGPPRRIVIAGRGRCAAAEAAQRRRPERYDLRQGTIPDDEAAALFASSDLLVLPYREASQSGVLSIAPTFGLPVVATDVGELGALVRDTGMGILVPPNRPDALAAAIGGLLADDQERAALGARSAAAAATAFADTRLSGPTLAAYASAVRKRRPVRAPAPSGPGVIHPHDAETRFT